MRAIAQANAAIPPGNGRHGLVDVLAAGCPLEVSLTSWRSYCFGATPRRTD
jgi:hypothetical protein